MLNIAVNNFLVKKLIMRKKPISRRVKELYDIMYVIYINFYQSEKIEQNQGWKNRKPG